MPGTRTVRTVNTTTDKWGNKTTTTTEETIEVNSDDQASDEEHQETRKQRRGQKKPKAKKRQQRNEEDSENDDINETNEDVEEGSEEEQKPSKPGSGGRQSQPVLQETPSNLGSAERGGLDAHNAARDGQNLPHLIWDAGLAAQAQAVADRCLKAKDLIHSDDSVLYPKGKQNAWQGENLAMEKGSFEETHNFFSSAVDNWMEEEKYYFNGRRDKAGHYTQVMWTGTQKVGMALATNGRSFFVAARYWPAGNINNRDPF